MTFSSDKLVSAAGLFEDFGPECCQQPLPAQVVHLLLCPQSNDLAWVQFAEAIFEAIIIFDVAIPVLELVQCRLEHLQHHLVGNRLLLQAETHTHGASFNNRIFSKINLSLINEAEGGVLAWLHPPPSIGVKDHRLFSCTDTAIDLLQHAGVHHLVHQQASARVHCLFLRRSSNKEEPQKMTQSYGQGVCARARTAVECSFFSCSLALRLCSL